MTTLTSTTNATTTTTTAASAAPTLHQMFRETAARFPGRVVLRHKVGKEWQSITYAELAQKVEAAAAGLRALGVVKGDRVSILSENRPEWAITDLAALSLGAIVVPIYPTLPSAQIAYIARNSGAKLLFVGDAKQFKKADEARATGLGELTQLIVFEPEKIPTGADVLPFADLLERGAQAPFAPGEWDALGVAVTPGDVASLVYTSGTTGDPKGTMLTHGNFVFDVDASLAHYASGGAAVSENDVFLSFLPLSHAYERTTGHFLPIRKGASIGYSEGVRTLAGDMAEIKPTIMVCVPRVYEALQERVCDTVAKSPENKRKLFAQALDTGKAWGEARRANRAPGLLLSLKRAVFEKLVYSKLRERFGGRFRFWVSGGAALNAETYRFFEAIGIPMSEGYGMTEASPAITTTPVDRPKLGTVGTAMPGVEVQIAGDGEVIARGPNVMKGYWQNENATREMIDADGWLHTGDIGVLDADGYLKITDRKKDILVLANGKNVAPQPIESALKRSPFIAEVVLIGDKQSVITALVLPDKSRLRDWAKTEGLSADADDALLALPEAKKKIKAEIDAQSTALADFEKIKKFTLLGATFSVDSGELTPTLKIKRKVVLQKYAREVADMRGGGGAEGE